jgi:hypothetical protein
MSSGAKLLLIVVGGSIVLCAATVAAGAAAIYGSGTIAVDVQEGRGGGGVSVNVPAGLANLALALVPDRIVEEALDDISVEFGPYLPALHKAWTEFEQAPDFVMVEIDDGRDKVRVEKKARKLLVSISGPGEDIRVELPIGTLRRIIRKL